MKHWKPPTQKSRDVAQLADVIEALALCPERLPACLHVALARLKSRDVAQLLAALPCAEEVPALGWPRRTAR